MVKEKSEFTQKLLRLVIPITLQQVMLALVSITDAAMLGVLNQDSLSAVSLAGQIYFVFGLFIYAVGAGVSIFAAQYWGIDDRVSVEKILGIGMRYSFIISLLFTLAAFFLPRGLMHCFASDETLISYGAEYLRHVAPAYLLTGISQIYLAVMKNCGFAAKSSVISSVSVVINIIFNALLIFGLLGFPKMGIAGAAVSTVISKAVELVWTLIVMFRSCAVKIRLKYIMHSDKTLKADYIKYTLPILGAQLGWGVGFTMYSVILGHMGSDAAAANSVANIIKNLVVCACTGIALASGVILGSELGKGNLETAKRYGSRLCHISLMSGFVSGAIILCITPFVSLFGSLTDTAREYLRVMLFVCSYYVVGKAMNMTVISGIFPAGGDSKFGFKCDTITMWCVTVPLGLISAFILKLPPIAVYIIINIDEIIKLPAVYKHYKKYLWLKKLTRD